jgi:hypothetical protein
MAEVVLHVRAVVLAKLRPPLMIAQLHLAFVPHQVVIVLSDRLLQLLALPWKMRRRLVDTLFLHAIVSKRNWFIDKYALA